MTSTSEFRIEKLRRRVTVSLAGGETLVGDLFLQSMARYRVGPQLPVELFNEEEPFFPLATAADDFVLIAKDHVTRVQFSAGPADTDADGIDGTPAEVVFADGTRLSGELRLETRASRSRVLDFLNEDRQRFLTLRFSGGICLVNRRQIAQIRHQA